MNTTCNSKILIAVMLCGLAACASPQVQPTLAPTEVLQPVSTSTPQANLPNPAAVYCEQQGYRVEIRTAADGSQTGYCIFPDGSECDEWAYFRNECGPNTAPKEIPTALPIDPADYQGWWTYTHPVYHFTILLPEEWVVEDVTASDPLMSGHALNLHPASGTENIRMTFRRVGEDALLWPTGVGQGDFIPQGTLDIAGQPARRVLLVCPSGEVTAIRYHNLEEDQPNITRGDLEFGFIFSAGVHCEPGLSLNGKVQRVGEMIIASLTAP